MLGESRQGDPDKQGTDLLDAPRFFDRGFFYTRGHRLYRNSIAPAFNGSFSPKHSLQVQVNFGTKLWFKPPWWLQGQPSQIVRFFGINNGLPQPRQRGALERIATASSTVSC